MQPPAAGLVQSLVIKGQRQLLDGLGEKLGTKVVYLKAAWADPVLYGGRGERVGCDLDAVVHPTRFFAFARALEGLGFQRYVVPWLRASFRWGYKAWTYEGAPSASWITVDLHRAIEEAPWFHLPVEACLDRAIAYDSVDGPILSLCPEDQIVYAAYHYAQHRFSLHQRHLVDMHRLTDLRPIDWDTVFARARPLGLDVALALLLEALAARGAKVPATRDEGPAFRWRLAAAHTWVATSPALARRLPWSRFLDQAVRMPLLSGRVLGLPRYLAGFAAWRSLDVAAEIGVMLKAKAGPRPAGS